MRLLRFAEIQAFSIICGGNDASGHRRNELLKSKKPSEITKATKEWAGASKGSLFICSTKRIVASRNRHSQNLLENKF